MENSLSLCIYEFNDMMPWQFSCLDCWNCWNWWSRKNYNTTSSDIQRVDEAHSQDRVDGSGGAVQCGKNHNSNRRLKKRIKNFKSIARDHKKKQRKLLILDINGLLADIVRSDYRIKGADFYMSRAKYSIFKRPNLKSFLEFCCDRFDVGIWSSRKSQNLHAVIETLMPEFKYKLRFVWDESHCTQTGVNTLENSMKPLVFKSLEKVWEKYLDFDESNTLLIDDSPYKTCRNYRMKIKKLPNLASNLNDATIWEISYRMSRPIGWSLLTSI